MNIDRPSGSRSNLSVIIKSEHSSTKTSYDALLKHENVNKLRFNYDNIVYPFNSDDFELVQGEEIISAEKCIVKKYLHRPANRIMAVKFVHIPLSIYKDPKKEKEMQKLIQEVKIHHQLSFSKHIVRLYGFCVYEGDALICMELMDMSLKEFYQEVHEKVGYFPECLLGVISVAIVNAFQDLHKVGIMHRDIKPNNILINLSGQIKLCDFGEAKLLENNLATSVVGTVAYWPPERMSAGHAYDTRSDIWSLGITLLELIYGKIPFEDIQGNLIDNYIAMIFFILNLNTQEMVARCFQKFSDKKYSYAKTFIALCLEKFENRPNYEDLLKTPLYEEYTHISIKMAIDHYVLELGSTSSKQPNTDRKEANKKANPRLDLSGLHGFCIPHRYLPGEKVASGMRGITMKAFDTNHLNKPVAIKKLRWDYVKSQESYREFVLLQMLDHENIIKLTDAFVTSTGKYENSNPYFRAPEHLLYNCYFVLEYYEHALIQLIHRHEKFFDNPEGHYRMAYITHQLLSGVNYLHSVGIIHRDLSPYNILLSNNFNLKIGHLGMVQDHNKKQDHIFSTDGSTNFFYRAPETLFGSEYDEKVDIWSIGCILMEMLVGELEFKGSTYYVQRKIINDLETKPDRLPKHIKETPKVFAVGIVEKLKDILINPKLKINVLASSSKNQYLNDKFDFSWTEFLPDKLFKNIIPSSKDKKAYKEFANLGRDYISKMLEIDPKKRISVVEALSHPFLDPFHLNSMPKPPEKINLDRIFKEANAHKNSNLLVEKIQEYAKKSHN